MADLRNPLTSPGFVSQLSNPLEDPRFRSNVPDQEYPAGVIPGQGSFETGLRSSAMGTEAGLRGFAANIAETAGLPEYAKSQLQEINKIQSNIPRARVERLEDIRNIGDVPAYAAYNAGAAAPTIATAALGGLGARGVLRAAGIKASPYTAEFAGSMAGMLPQEAGEAAINMYNDPNAMANTTPGQRTALMLGKGGINAALESVVPSTVVGKLAAPALHDVGQGFMGTLKHVGREVAKDAALESLTEGAQQIVGQGFQHVANPNVSAFPSQSDLLNAMAAGFVPGAAMGGVGGGIDVVKNKLSPQTAPPSNPLTSLISAAKNPQLSAFVNTLAPDDVKAKGAQGIVDWMTSNPDALQKTIQAAHGVANDETLPSSVRERAKRVVDTNGAPESIREMTGIAGSHQQGLEFGNLLKNLADTTFQAAHGVVNRLTKNKDGETKFSAIDVQPTAEEMFVQKQVAPFMAVKDPAQTRAATSVIQDYLTSAAKDPAAKMPAGLMNIFAPGKAQEGLKAAHDSMYRAGLLEKDSTPEVTAKVDDAIKRQTMWRDLLKTELSPEHDVPSESDLDKIAYNLEVLSTKDSAQFMNTSKAIFGKNTDRALTRMETLLPSTTQSLLTQQVGANEEAGQLASVNERAASISDQAATMGEDEAVTNRFDNAGISVRDVNNDVKWGTLKGGAYDLENSTHAQYLKENAKTADKSGLTQTGPVGIVDYSKKTQDNTQLAVIKEQHPELTNQEINDRFKVLATHQKGEAAPEQLTYDEVTAEKKNNPWTDEHTGEGSLRFYEPNSKRAKVVTTANRLITAMRQKAGQLNSDLVGPEQNMADFSRAISSMLDVKKDGSHAFDKVTVTVKDPKGKGVNATKEVPLNELPDDFTLFPNVTVADVRSSLTARAKEAGVKAPVSVKEAGTLEKAKEANARLVNTETKVKLADMELQELSDQFHNAEEKLSQKRLPQNAKESLKGKMKAIVAEIKSRMEEANLDGSVEDIIRGTLPEISGQKSLFKNTQSIVSPSISKQLPPRTNEKNLKSLQETETVITGKQTTVIDRDNNGNLMNKTTATSMMNPNDSLVKLGKHWGVERTLGIKTNVKPKEVSELETMGAEKEEPRIYDEWGNPLDPRESVYLKGTKSGVKAYATRVANQIKMKESKRSETLVQTLRDILTRDMNLSDKIAAIKQVERQALVEGIITPEQAESRHFFKQNDKIVIMPKKEQFNAQNSMDPLISEPMGAEDKQVLAEWLRKVLPEHILEFVSELGGMSGSFSKTELGKSLIKINVFAYDHLSVAYHEAMHALFSEMKAGNHVGAINVLNKVALSGRVQSQLKELLKDNPAALNQLNDPEEAGAYLFQFWMAGKINLGPQTETFFQKLSAAIKNFFGFVADEKLVDEMFTLFAAGGLKNEVSRDVNFTNMGKPIQNKFVEYAKPIMDKAGQYTKSVDNFFRNSGNEHLVKLMDLFENKVGGTNKNLGYFKAVEQVRNHTLNKLSEDLRNVSKPTLDLAITELQKGTLAKDIKNDEVKKVVEMTHKLLDQLHDYMVRKNVTSWDGTSIGKIKNYFPRVWNVDSLLTNGDEFVKLLVENHSDELEKMGSEANGNFSAQDVAEALLSKMLRNMGVTDLDAENQAGLKENERVLGFSPALGAANERVYKFLDMNKFNQFLEKDYVTTMTRYIHQATKKAEYSSRFGSDGKLLQKMMDQATQLELDKILSKDYGSSYVAKRDALLAKAQIQPQESLVAFEVRVLSDVFEDYAKARTQATAKADDIMKPYRQGVMALEGTLGHDISPTLRKVNSTVGAYQNLRLLPLALFSSLIDPLGIVVRGGKLEHAKSAFLRGMKEVYKGWKGEFTGAEDADVKLAELMGTLEPSSFLDSLGQTYGSMFMTSGARKINDTLFRLNGMEGWNRAMRTQATLAAVDFIKGLKGEGKHNARYMEELGLSSSDINIDAEGKLDLMNPQVRQAVMRWVDGAILRPNAAQRPAWASNPKFALLFHLMQFTYSFQKEIMGRVINEAKHGNIDPMVTMAVGYVPTMMAASMARAVVQGGGSPPDFMKDDTLFDWVKRGVFQSGMFGVPGASLQGASQGDSLGAKVFDAAASYTGPTIKQGIDAVNDDLSTTGAKALPLQVVYRHWFD